MTSKTHLAFGLLTSIIIKKYFPGIDSYILVSATSIGSLLPDIDSHKSLPSKIIPEFAKIIDKFTVHRGATHMIFPFIFIIAYFLTESLPCLFLGVGGISHLVLDKLTYSLHITCDSKGESIIYYSSWILNLILIFDILFDFVSEI